MKSFMHRTTWSRVARALAVGGAAFIMASSTVVAQAAQAGPPAQYRPLPADQLDSLVAPIALYADPLLAQVMLAATYPQQVDEAAKWVRVNGTAAVDSQPWDVSVRAVAHYPSVLNLLDSNLDWTAWLGAAYANQSTDLMNAVQRMRALAQANGNLASTPQQQVITDGGNISVEPAQPQVIYVPVYDPAVVYYDSCLDVFCDPFVQFSVGYPIGPWLIYDWNWPARRIYYTGWVGGGWIARSRPYIRLSGVYVNERFRTVPFNRGALPVTRGARPFGGARPATLAPTARPLVTRAEPPAVRSSPVSAVRGEAPAARANGAIREAPQSYGARQAPTVRQGEPTYGPRQVPRPTYQAPRPTYVAPRATYQVPRAYQMPRPVYQAPRQVPAQAPRAYAAPRQAAPAPRQAAPAPRGGGRPASRGGGRR
ncbi:MAG TPA: DUF3300 domain-containing protein [Gemmatimonadaceae bacterium]|nr:DUF3300 domain-containing protein [Gemmatimonadaceae bacterium]